MRLGVGGEGDTPYIILLGDRPSSGVILIEFRRVFSELSWPESPSIRDSPDLSGIDSREMDDGGEWRKSFSLSCELPGILK